MIEQRKILVNTKEAAQLLGLSVSLLEKWRFHKSKHGPPVVRVGRSCRYSLDDLKAWISAHRS